MQWLTLIFWNLGKDTVHIIRRMSVFPHVILVPVPSSVSQRRYELNRTVLGSESFSLLGNRQAVSVDYMPVLRYICRFQREQQQKEEPVR